ncbi:MAG: hypothetical protein M1344_01450 [Candidatus Thermoplasmatota archaeon]|nr:hypothetical protein [Candidatus Thermoplasmatota archaeon]
MKHPPYSILSGDLNSKLSSLILIIREMNATSESRDHVETEALCRDTWEKPAPLTGG